MGEIVIESDALRVGVLPWLGAGVSRFECRGGDGRWTALLRMAGTGWFNELGSYLLAPWPNRIVGAAFTHAGKKRQLKADWIDGTAIHGDVKARGWRVLDRSPVAVRLECEVRDGNWPWPFVARVRYSVESPGRFETELSVRNLGEEAFPAGLGFHPFWFRRLGSEPDDAVIRVRGLARYPAVAMIPTGPAAEDEVCRAFAAGTTLEKLVLDDVFSGTPHGAEIRWPAAGVRVRYACSANLGHTVVYSPAGAGYFCLEPVTMVNDGFNLMTRGQAGTGTEIVSPGGAMVASWACDVECGV